MLDELALLPESIVTLLREGKPGNVSDSDIEAIAAAVTKDEIVSLVNDVFATDPHIVGDGAVRAVLAHYLWVALLDGKQVNKGLEADVIIGTAMGAAVSVILRFNTEARADRTVDGFRAYIKGAFQKMFLREAEREWLIPKMGTHKGEKYVRRPAHAPGRKTDTVQLGEHPDQPHQGVTLRASDEEWGDAVDMADAVAVFFRMLDVYDRQILLPLHATPDQPEVWILHEAATSTREANLEQRERDRRLARLHDVDVSTIAERRKFLLQTFNKFLEGENVACNLIRPHWFNRPSTPFEHAPSVGEGGVGPHANPDDTTHRKPARGYRPRQSPPWACAGPARRHGVAMGVRQ
ncbi:hypothetical protein [Lacipirellula sp.]|uniref:hypothetical protein n=1 Tax=Lacipirellula sp. TaxID=2691419 RepID=UPI003D0B25B3